MCARHPPRLSLTGWVWLPALVPTSVGTAGFVHHSANYMYSVD